MTPFEKKKKREALEKLVYQQLDQALPVQRALHSGKECAEQVIEGLHIHSH